MANHTLVSVDLAKAVFQIAVSDRPGGVCRRERVCRGEVLPFFAQLPQATVVMEVFG